MATISEDKILSSPSNASKAGKSGTNYSERFAELTASDIESQVEFFLKSFIFDLGDDWGQVNVLAKKFTEYLNEKAEKHDLDAGQAADFLQRMGRTRTAMQRRSELADVDLDKNDKICFIEYLLLHYKIMILKAYFARHKMDPTVSMENDGVGLTGVGPFLLEELFTVPVGCDPAVLQAIEEFMAKQRQRNTLVKELQAKVAQGGVKGLAAKNELFQLDSQDKTEMNRVELTLSAAKRRSSKNSGEVALAKAQQQEEELRQQKQQESRNKLAARAAAFENKQ